MSDKRYRVVTTEKVIATDHVFAGIAGVTYLNIDNRPTVVLKDDVVAILETLERDVTTSFIERDEPYR